MGDKVSNFEPPFQLFLSKTSKKKGNRTHGARPAPWNRSAAASQQASTGYGDARAHDDPLKQQSKRPNHQNLPKKQLPRVSLSPPSSIISPPGCALLLVVTSPLSVSLHLPPHLAASGDLAAFPFRVPGRSLEAEARASGRMSLFRRLFYRRPPDGLVEISANILGACTFLTHHRVILLF
jgi:hypothetical protein